MTAARLTANAVSAVTAGDLDLKPVVQLLGLRRAPVPEERYRALVSDGAAFEHAMLATQLNDVVKSGRLRSGSVVQLLEYICSTIQSRRVVIILNLEIMMTESEIIGSLILPPDVDSVSEDSNSRTELLNSATQPFPQNAASTSAGSSSNEARSSNAVVQPSYRPPPNYKSRGAIMKNEAPARIIPIAALNPYQGRWAIKARVTAKGDIRRYNNAKGDGKVFSFDLLDSDGGEIRVTCFNAIVDRFYEVIEVGKIYIMSKGSLKPAKKNFNHLNNQWEIFMEASSTLELCPDEDSSIPEQKFSFKGISEIENSENNDIVDVIGIVISVNPSATILRKNGMETQRRILYLKDISDRSVEITLWGDFCNKEGRYLQEMLDSGKFPVLAIKAGRVNDFTGKSVGTVSSTQLFINPTLPEAQRLNEWFDGGGKDSATQSISRDLMPGLSQNNVRKTVSQIKDEGLGRGNKPDWILIKAVINFIKTDNFCYTACPLLIGDKRCSKKVTRVVSGNWCCNACDKEFEECDYRYLLQIQVQDYTGMTWLTAFQESGEEIIGYSAKELYMLKFEEHDDSKFAEIIRKSLFKQYMFKLKIKEELYGDEQRVKITVVKAENLDPSTESRFLLDLFSALS